MKKIAFLSIYSGIVDRGVETFVYELSRRLSKKYSVIVYQSQIASNNQRSKIITVKNGAQIPKASKGLLGKFYIDLQSLRILIFTLKCLPSIIKKKPDVIIPVNGGWQTFIIRLISKLLGQKMIVSGHAGIGSDDAWNILFKPDIFVALTNSQFQWARNLSDEINTEKIPNGVDLSFFNPKVKPKNLKLKKPIVLCASALVPYKRVSLTIRAVAKTNKLSLLVLGSGENQGHIDSLGKRLLKNRYLRLNPEYQDMPKYYNSANIFTLASSTEAFGISYLEAMACNLPIVTTNDVSRQEIIGKAGILTNPENTIQYANDLLMALQTDYRNIPYDQALKYSWNKIANSYSKIIMKFN